MNKSVGRMVSILYRKNQVYLNTALKPYAITASEIPIITYLLNHEGASQEEISSYLVIDKGATARAVQTLIGKAFLRKETDPDDRRLNRLYLTEKTRQLRPCIQGILLGWTDYLAEGLDPQDVDTMYRVLNQMIQKVENVDFEEIRRNI